MAVKKVTPRDPIESLCYPTKVHRPMGKKPVTLPGDPVVSSYVQFKGKKQDPKKFSYSLYFTAFDVRDYGENIMKFMKIFTNLNIKKVYLETYRDGYTAEKSVLLAAKKALENEKIKVAGGITTTHLSEKTEYNEIYSPASCYSDKNANRALRKIVDFSADIFKEIIIDDWFFTICKCPDCRKGKGKRTWEEFRSKLIYDVARKNIIEHAKKTHKNVKFILKLPNWMEMYYTNGYDLERLIPIFDEIAVGTETRQHKQGRFMPMHGLMLFNYIKGLAPAKTKKAWYDVYMSDEQIYVEQAYQSVLGGAEEVILFCAGAMPHEKMRVKVEALIANTEKIDRFSNFSRIFNIPLIRKTNTTGDSMLSQYLLMLGIPIYLTDKTKFKESMVVMTEQSGKKTEYSRMFNAFLKDGKDMLITANVAKEIKKYFDVRKLKKPIKIEYIKYGGRQNTVKGNASISYEISNGKHLALVNGAYSFLSYTKIKNRNIWILNVPEIKDRIMDEISGVEQSADFRMFLHNREMADAIKSAFKKHANMTLYDRIKTFYKYDV